MIFRGDWTGTLAELFGEREAIFEVSSGRRLSYLDLARATDEAARLLVDLGVERGERVAVLAHNRLETLLLMFATARLGAIFVPLNWRLAQPELEFLLDDCEPRALFFDEEHAHLAGRLCGPRGVSSLSLDWKEGPAGPAPAQVAIDADDPWMILYTSGTTGHPKGALIPHRQVAYNALNTMVALDLTSADRTVTYTPLFHTGALHVLTTPLLCKGGSIVLTDGFDADQVLRLSAEERCTLLFGVPTTFEMMAETESFTALELDTVRVALCGGAPCPPALIERYNARGIVFKQGYGLTEVGPNCLNLPEAEAVRRAGSAGRPNLQILARVLGEGGLVEGAGRGELALAGPCVFLGYWRRPDANRACFTEEGYFLTGDVVERDAEGWYTIVDRAKDMFISGGENVYPAEVEKVLSSHPAVRACAVVGIPDPRWGEVGRAYLEARSEESAVEGAELRTWLKERLATYKVPKEYVVVEALPRNPSGKIMKHVLGVA
ncbi:MAG: AMP-binding protein [Deltaproteobacteria bacterium]|nr:AMP-binding protein [Deltaproteobacteria bacterium]